MKKIVHTNLFNSTPRNKLILIFRSQQCLCLPLQLLTQPFTPWHQALVLASFVASNANLWCYIKRLLWMFVNTTNTYTHTHSTILFIFSIYHFQKEMKRKKDLWVYIVKGVYKLSGYKYLYSNSYFENRNH